MSDDMPAYDPLEAPDPEWWLALDEDERNILVAEYHRRARSTLPNVRAHAIFHAVVETQVAMGDDLPVAATLARLQSEGLDRHEAIHAIGSVLAGQFHGAMSGARSGDLNAAYVSALLKLSAESWRHAR
jgi:hypothetical protein